MASASESQTSDARSVSLDVLKVAMALMVIGLHANFMRDHSETLWWYTVNGLFRLAVPVFLITNGYFFATRPPTEDLRWIKRIVFLYLVWTAIYAPIWLPTTQSLSKLAILIAFGWFHLWYLAGLIGAYFCLALFRRLGGPFLLMAMISCFLAGVALQYGAFEATQSSFVGRVLEWNPSHRNFLLFSFPFFTAGYLIRKHKLDDRFGAAASGAMCLAGLLLLFLEARAVHALTSGAGDVDNLLSLGLLAPAAFLTAMKVPFRGGWGKTASQLANGLYFSHPLFLVGLAFEGLLEPTLATVATAAASAALTAVIMAFPALSKRLL